MEAENASGKKALSHHVKDNLQLFPDAEGDLNDERRSLRIRPLTDDALDLV